MRNILKQSSYLFLAQIFNRLISFFYIIYLARVLGVDQFGLYTVALAYFAIISAIADLGFNRFLIREVSKDISRTQELMSNILLLRLTLTSILFAVFSVVLYLTDPNHVRVSLVLLATVATIPQSIAFTFDGIFVSLRKLQYSAIGIFSTALITALSGYFLVSRGLGPFGAVIALVIGQAICAFVLFIFLFDRKKIVFSLVGLNKFKEVLKGSLPYGLLGVLGLLYFKIDAIMLSYLKGSFETGIYGAAYKFLEAAVFIPVSFSAALFPALAKLHDENKPEMKKLYFKSLKLMFVAGIAVAAGYILILPVLINKFLPSYIQAIDVIKILALSIPFMFIAAPGVQVLFSSEKYLKTVIGLSLVTLAFNVILNLIFIPQFSFIAAAWITFASEVLSFFVFFVFIKRKVIHQ